MQMSRTFGSNTCKRVDGQISPEARCAIWAKLA